MFRCPPYRGNLRWQAHTEEAFDVSCFAIDWDHQQAICPAGHTSHRWFTGQTDNRGKDMINIQFAREDCQECSLRARCTTARAGRRLSVRPKEQYLALQAARQFQHTPAFQERYNARAGIEGTISQGLRVCDLRHARYTGLAKTRLQHVLTAAAVNVVRSVRWLEDPHLATTRHAPFLALLPQSA